MEDGEEGDFLLRRFGTTKLEPRNRFAQGECAPKARTMGTTERDSASADIIYLNFVPKLTRCGTFTG